jgi:hypothetical protein
VAAHKAGQIDVKKARAVRKALHDLEKLEWFKPQQRQALRRVLRIEGRYGERKGWGKT